MSVNGSNTGIRLKNADVPLDLGEAIVAIYEEAAYNLSIDYRQLPPRPRLSQADHYWLDHLLTTIRGLEEADVEVEIEYGITNF